MQGISGEAENLWETFHFSEFEIPLPVRHPMFVLIPIIHRRKVRPEIGAKFKTRGKLDVGSFTVLKSFKFDRRIEHHKIFELPFFKNHILKKNDKTVWKDLFTKSFSLPKGELTEKSYWMNLWNISYKELVYNLYLLELRSKFLPENARKLSYYNNKSFGIIELINIESQKQGLEDLFRKELIYVYHNGYIYKLLLKSRYENQISESIRKRIMKALKYRTSDESSAIEIYARYKELPYYKRISQEGMTYLYAGWSHVTEKKEFIKEMIQFLERGRNSYDYLEPLYEYSYKEFGTNYSILKDNLKESASEQLKRKIIEEEQLQDQKIINEINTDVEGEFETEDQKVDYFLKKAKGNQSDEESNILFKD